LFPTLTKDVKYSLVKSQSCSGFIGVVEGKETGYQVIVELWVVHVNPKLLVHRHELKKIG
jgi:hypothetical protein